MSAPPPDDSHDIQRPPTARPVVLLMICSGIIAFAGLQTVQQLSKGWPIHQWESGMVAEFQRAADGMQIYESAEDGHATHMYGPGLTYLVGTSFRFFGPNFLTSRLLSLFGIVATLVLMLAVLTRRTQWLVAVVAIASVAAFGPCVLNFVEPRPDCISLFFATLAVIMMARGCAMQALLPMLLATALTIVGMLFKQPAAMVAAIPLLAVVLDRQRPVTVNRVVLAGMPLFGTGTTLAAMAWLTPAAFHYFVQVPAQYGISPTDLLIWSAKLTVLLSATLLVAIHILGELRNRVDGCGSSVLRTAAVCRTTRQAWAAAAFAVTVPCSLLTASKTGGNANCLLPAVIAAAAVLLAWADELMTDFLVSDRRFSRLPLSASSYLSAVLVAGFTLCLMTSVRSDVSYGDSGFASVVAHIKETGQPVACVQDPAAAVFAGRRPGRSLILEYDAAGWPEHIPGWFFDELQGAEFVVSVGQGDDWRFWPVSGRAMQEFIRQQGFERLPLPSLKNSVYCVWRRADSRRAESAPRLRQQASLSQFLNVAGSAVQDTL
jgi:hypothetical protein